MTGTYLDVFYALPHISWLSLLSLFFLTLMRLAPIVALAPFLGAKIAPAMARVAIAICLAVIFLPSIMVNTTHNMELSVAFAGYAVKELFIGFVLGFLVSFPFHIISSAGLLIDFLRGASVMQQQDPMLQQQASPIGILFNYILIVLFFQIGGYQHFFSGVLDSYRLIPVDAYINPDFFAKGAPFWQMATDLLNQLVTIAIQLAAPALVAILMAEMFLGIANRLAPQVQIAFLGMSLKSLLALFVLWAGWFFLLKQFVKQSNNWLQLIDNMMSFFKSTV